MISPETCLNCVWFDNGSCQACGISPGNPADFTCCRYKRKVILVDNHNSIGPNVPEMRCVVDKESGHLMYKSYKIDKYWYNVNDEDYQKWYMTLDPNALAKMTAEEIIIDYLKSKGEIK